MADELHFIDLLLAFHDHCGSFAKTVCCKGQLLSEEKCHEAPRPRSHQPQPCRLDTGSKNQDVWKAKGNGGMG